MKYPKLRCVTAGSALTIFLMQQSLLANADNKSHSPSAPNPPPITAPAEKDGKDARPAAAAERESDDAARAEEKANDEKPADRPSKPSPPAAPSNVRVTPQSVRPGMSPGDPLLLPTGRTRQSLLAPLDVSTFTPALRNSTIATRPQILGDLEAKLGASEIALSSLEKSSPEMSAEGRARLRAVADDARESARNLRQTLREARSADERSWTTVRAQLADDYAAYARALSQIDRVAGSSAR